VSITDLYNPALKCMSSPTKPVFVAKHLLSSKPDGVVVKTTSIGVINKAFSQKVGEAYFSSNGSNLQHLNLKKSIRFMLR